MGRLADSGALPRLVEIFAEQTPERIAELRHAAESGDHATVTRVAHTMKGGAASLGAAAMADVCKQLEETGRTGSLTGATELIDSIESAFEAARDALGREVAAAGA